MRDKARTAAAIERFGGFMGSVVVAAHLFVVDELARKVCNRTVDKINNGQ